MGWLLPRVLLPLLPMLLLLKDGLVVVVVDGRAGKVVLPPTPPSEGLEYSEDPPPVVAKPA